MAHAFQTVPAKPAFATLKQNLYQSDYINKKKRLLIYYNSPFICNRLRIAPRYNILPINKSNLIIGQYTASNLSQVCTVSNIFPYTTPAPCSSDYPCNPCQNNNAIQLSTSDVIYNKFVIDPNGELFGKTQCGELNFTQFMLFYPPTPPTKLGFS